MLLFVYGTLKRGMRANHLLRREAFVEVVRSAPLYRLYSLGPYPALVEDNRHPSKVEGELWEIREESIPELDEYEGVPNLFDRRVLELEDGRNVQAYFYVRSIPTSSPAGDRWPFIDPSSPRGSD